MPQIKRQDFHSTRRIKQLKAPGRCGGSGGRGSRVIIMNMCINSFCFHVLHLRTRSLMEFDGECWPWIFMSEKWWYDLQRAVRADVWQSSHSSTWIHTWWSSLTRCASNGFGTVDHFIVPHPVTEPRGGMGGTLHLSVHVVSMITWKISNVHFGVWLHLRSTTWGMGQPGQVHHDM